jgi:hypothetical protein
MKAPHLVAAQNGSIHSRPTSPSPAKICDPAKTVLVVDDDPMVRDVEAQVLRLQIKAAPKHPGINVGFDARPGITI